MGPQPRPVPVLVLGHSVTALGVLRSLARAGIPSYSLCRLDDFAGWSRWAQRLPAILPDTCSVDELSAWLNRLPFERLVLMPCTDAWARTVGGLDPALSPRFPNTGASNAVFDRLTDKLVFAGIAAASGIPHPRTHRIDRVEDLRALPIAAGSGYFLKARDSQALMKQLGVKAFQVNSIDEAELRFAQARAVGQDVMVQEYLPGPPTSHYFLDGFVDRHGVVLARFARQRLRMYPQPFGNSSSMRSLPLDEVPDIVGTIDRLAAATDLRGIFSVELKRDPRDGVAKVLDVNVRPWWFVDFASVCGVNVCDLAYRTALGEPVGPVTSYTAGRTCVLMYFDYGACRRLHRARELSFAAWVRSWARSAHTIFSARDPLPSVHYYGTVLLGYLRRSPGRIARTLRRRMHALPWLRSSLPANRTS